MNTEGVGILYAGDKRSFLSLRYSLGVIKTALQD